MNTLFAMRRANGDWFALDDEGLFRVPVFRSSGAAMVARSRDFGMECFRPVAIDEAAFRNLTTTDEGKACFWLVDDPLMNLSRGHSLDRQGLEQFMRNGAGRAVTSEVAK
jgi:hypothetical protein